MFIAINCIFISIDDILIWIGNPKPYLRRFRLATGAFCFLLKTTCLFLFVMFDHVCQHLVFHLFAKISNRPGTQLRPERWSIFVLSSHLVPIWSPKRCPIIANISWFFGYQYWCGRVLCFVPLGFGMWRWKMQPKESAVVVLPFTCSRPNIARWPKRDIYRVRKYTMKYKQ